MVAADLDAVVVNEASAYWFPWSRRAFADCIEAQHECHVAHLGERVIGHGVATVVRDEAQLLNVCIAPQEQGRGYGRALAAFLLQCAAALDARVAYLEVRVSNQVAIALYETLGFRRIGCRRNYYQALVGRENALVMALELDNRYAWQSTDAPCAGWCSEMVRSQ